MAKAQIGSLTLGEVPRVAAIIGEMLPMQAVDKLSEKGADLLEIRFDLFTEPFAKIIAYVKKLREAVDLPLIGTLRETRGNKSKRLAMFEEILPLVDAFDIELDAEIGSKLVNKAQGKVVIVSEHNYESTPGREELETILAKSVDRGAQIVKIATMATCREDVTRLMRFTEDHAEPLVSIAMGDAGKISRVVAPLFGSLFTYGYVSHSAAPGQLSLEGLVDALRLLYPSYDRMFDQFAQ